MKRKLRKEIRFILETLLIVAIGITLFIFGLVAWSNQHYEVNTYGGVLNENYKWVKPATTVC